MRLSSPVRYQIVHPTGYGEMADASDLDMSTLREISCVNEAKFGESLPRVKPLAGNAEPSLRNEEGVETRRFPLNGIVPKGEGIVQRTNRAIWR